MSTEKKVRKFDPAEMENLIGASPVLRTENEQLYQKLRNQFLSCMEPEDVIVWTLVDRLVVDVWSMWRFGRHQTVAIERTYNQPRNIKAKTLKINSERLQAQADNLRKDVTYDPNQVQRLVALDDQAAIARAQHKEIVDGPVTEESINQALEESMPYQQGLDILNSAAARRFAQRLELITHYRESLGKRLHAVAREIVDADFEEVADPPVQPSPSITPHDTAPAKMIEDRGAAKTPAAKTNAGVHQ